MSHGFKPRFLFGHFVRPKPEPKLLENIQCLTVISSTGCDFAAE